MKLRRFICWFWGHDWEVVDGKRHCVACDYTPNDEGVRFCPECGSERLMGHIMVSRGFQFVSCRACDHKFQNPEDPVDQVAFGNYCYDLERPDVNQDGNPLDKDGNPVDMDGNPVDEYGNPIEEYEEE